MVVYVCGDGCVGRGVCVSVSLVSLVSLVDSLSQRLMLFAQDSGATP